MALKDPYCDRTCADTYLADSEIWNSATDSEKDSALFWGRTYLDSNYRCPNLDETNPSDEIKYANALLAEDYLEGTLLASDGSNSNQTVRSKRVKADVVESETEYMGGLNTNPQQDVDALLTDQCSKRSGKYYKVITRT